MFAKDIGDDRVRRILQEALVVGNTSSPTERLGESIIGLAAAREAMDERCSDTIINEINEAIMVRFKAR